MNKVASKITEHLLLMDVIDQKDAAIYCYGLEVLLLSLLETISILCLALLVGNFFETLFYFAAFIPLRLFAGGYHASTRLRCYLLSLFVYGIFTWLLTVFPSEHRLLFSAVVAGFSAVMVFLFEPVIHVNRYWEEQEQMHYWKKSRQIVLIEMLIIFVCNIFQMRTAAFIMALGLLSETLTFLAAKLLIHEKQYNERSFIDISWKRKKC